MLHYHQPTKQHVRIGFPANLTTNASTKNCQDCFTIVRDQEYAEEAVSHATTGYPNNKVYLTVKIEGKPCNMEIDTGSSNSIISWYTLNKLVPNISKHSLSCCSIQLRDYQGNVIPVLGKGDFQVESLNFTGKLPSSS